MYCPELLVIETRDFSNDISEGFTFVALPNVSIGLLL